MSTSVELHVISEIRQFVADTSFELFEDGDYIGQLLSKLMVFLSDDFFQLGSSLGVPITTQLFDSILLARLNNPAISSTNDAVAVLLNVCDLHEDFVLSKNCIANLISGHDGSACVVNALLDSQVTNISTCDIRTTLYKQAVQALQYRRYHSKWLLHIFVVLREDIEEAEQQKMIFAIVADELAAHDAEQNKIERLLVTYQVRAVWL